MLKRIICIFLLTGLGFSPGCWGRVIPKEEEPIKRKEFGPFAEDVKKLLDSRFGDIILKAKEKVFPALVFVKPVQEEFSGGERRSRQIFGSGVIVDPAGFVITNNHVAEKAKRIKCVLATKEEIPATIIGLDRETDIAVLKLDLDALEEIRRKSGKLKKGEKLRLPFATFGNSSELREGEHVMAMGSPFGFDRSISVGVVSCTNRSLEDNDQPYTLWVQVDAAINPGNSGGPLVDSNGKIVGINARKIMFGDNIGFAIPASLVKPIYEELRKNKRIVRAWNGIKFQALRDFSKDISSILERGVIVASVEPGSPAYGAGLLAGDLILKLNGEPVDAIYKNALPGIRLRFATLPIEDQATLDVERGGKLIQIIITPIERGKSEGSDFECKKWKFTVKEISKHADPVISFYRPKGVYIQGVKPGGAASAAGLRRRDIIVKIDGRAVESLSEMKQVYEELITRPADERKALMEIQRQVYHYYLVLDYRKQDKKDEEK
ncbi:MAG: PDZ domain-containing protein [Planctomycetota bacterium]|nr:MAG: PDZ domain-containing protein [Planctomycetota bacterium]